MVPFFLRWRIDYTLYYRKEVLNMKKVLQKTKQWTKDNKEMLAFVGFVATTSVAIGSIVRMVSKGEDVSEELNVVEESVEDIYEVRVFLGGLDDNKDAGSWVVNYVNAFKDPDGNIIEYTMDKIAEDIINGDYKEV